MTATIKHSRGFTLIELVAVLTISTLVAVLTIPAMTDKWTERRVDNAGQEVQAVFTAAQRFRLDTGTWPANVAQLTAGNYLVPQRANAPFGGGYTFATVGPDFRIQFDAAEGRYANRLSSRLPIGAVAGTVVTTQISPPGQEASLIGLYARDGSRALTGPLAGGNQDAEDLNDIYALRLIDRAGGIVDPSGDSTFLGEVAADSGDITNNLDAGGDITAGNRVTARSFRDSDNPGRFLDPSATSRIETLRAENRIHSVGQISSGTSITASRDIFAGRDMRAGRNLNVTNRTTTDELRTNELRITQASTAGGSCTTGEIGRTSTGEVMSCVSGTWTKPGMGEGILTNVGMRFGSYSGYNNFGAPILVMAHGGSAQFCSGDGENRYHLRGSVGGTTVQDARNNNDVWAKSGSISFMVPHGTSFVVRSSPYGCSVGRFQLSYVRFD